MHAFQEFRGRAKHSQAPVTVGLVVAIALAFMIAWFTKGRWFGVDLLFAPTLIAQQPWGMITYPFASGGDGNGLIGVFFVCLWLWGIGGSVERELGPLRYALFWVGMTFLGALFHWIGFMVAGGSLTPMQSALLGAFFPVSAVTVAWGTRNPTATVTLMFVLPILGKWLAVLSVLLVFFGTNSPILAVFAIIPLGLAYLYAADKIPFLPWTAGKMTPRETKRAEKRQYAKIDEALDRQKDREERERLRRIFEASLIDDPEDKR